MTVKIIIGLKVIYKIQSQLFGIRSVKRLCGCKTTVIASDKLEHGRDGIATVPIAGLTDLLFELWYGGEFWQGLWKYFHKIMNLIIFQRKVAINSLVTDKIFGLHQAGTIVVMKVDGVDNDI